VIRLFFCGKFSPLGDKKKMVSKSNKGIFEFFSFFGPYLDHGFDDSHTHYMKDNLSSNEQS
jgi:hypothetical protein